MFLYKIRNKNEEYSSGGLYPRFSKTGKVWLKLSQLKSHLSLVLNFSKEKQNKIIELYKDCDIVEYEVKETNSFPVESEMHEVTKTYKTFRY